MLREIRPAITILIVLTLITGLVVEILVGVDLRRRLFARR